jgi:diguanylate cyclase (GGDEF)-like protein
MPAATHSEQPRWTRWLVAALVAMLLLYGVDVLFHPLPSSVSTLFQKFASCAAFLGTAVLCVTRGRASRAERSVWWLLALTMTLYAAGQAYYALVYWDYVDPPFPSIADGFWLLFYLPAYTALYKLLRMRSRTARKGVWLDALVAGFGVGGAGAALVFQKVLENTDGKALAVATNLAYPVGDLGLLGFVVAAVTITGWRAAGVWRWIAFAFAFFAVSDCVYLVQVAEGAFVPGTLVDLGWPTAAVLLGLAAWRTEAPVPSTRRPRLGVVLPAISGLGALTLLSLDHFVRTNVLALELATASIFVILVRLYLTVQDNARMLAQSRLEAATDALTGLGNRRRLTADLASHLEDLDDGRPLMLTLFDLDGFKQYNDTFGHPAGDQLLERLGARLREAVADGGTAYRMGGDEFCVLERGAFRTAEAVEALSEHGEEFSIECSSGSVTMPAETTDATEALVLADRRMYIRKGSRRASAGRQSADVLQRALAERDAELGAHQDCVAELATEIAMQLGVPPEEAEAARQTALLHDIGKVALPDEILRKPAPLDAAEWAFMKRHTIIGERIISAAPALAAVARYVRSTHERWDGDGYPDGLAAEEIPLIARVVSVCDAYDAMVTTRAYRAAWPGPDAVAELRRCAGTQFDRSVVDAFVIALGAMQDSRRSGLPSVLPGHFEPAAAGAPG